MSTRKYRYDFENMRSGFGPFDPGGPRTGRHSDHGDDHLDGGGDDHIDAHFDMHLVPGIEAVNPDPTLERLRVVEQRLRALEVFVARMAGGGRR
jgi:hypothetical protein